MKSHATPWTCLGIILSLLLLGWSLDPALSQDILPNPPRVFSNPPDRKIEDRLDSLEKQNELLIQKLQELQKQNDALSPPSGKTESSAVASSAKTSASKTEEKSGESIVGKNLKIEGVWKNGMFFHTADNAFTFSVGGTVQMDMGWFGANQGTVNSIGAFNNFVDPGLALSDGMDFRRARVRFNGSVYEVVEYYAQYDFAQSIDLRRRTIGVSSPAAATIYDNAPAEGTQFNEVFVGITQLPVVGALRVGHHREGLNFITSTADRNQVWMERGLLFDAFNGDFNFSSGVTLDRTYLDGRAYSWLGFFQNNSRTFSSVGDGDYVYDIRLTALPVWEPKEELWIHVGVDYSYRNLTQNQVRFRGRPMIRVGSGFQVVNVIDTGTFFSRDAQQIANLEFASAAGPWTFAAEAACSWVTDAYTGGLPQADGKLPSGAAFQGTYFSHAAYIELLRFITPDHRQYRKERPGYDRVAPRGNFFLVDGPNGTLWNCGAWEVGVRYDYADLSDGGVNGGVGQAATLALNWYLNPNARFQWNYFVMTRDFESSNNTGRQDGTLQGLGFRANIDF